MNISSISSAIQVTQVPGASATPEVSPAEKSSFAESVGDALADLDSSHQVSDDLASAAATGDLESLTAYVVAATEAQLATQVTVAVRNKAVSAFNQIMGMNI